MPGGRYTSGRKSELRGINDQGKQQTKKSGSMFALAKELRGKLWLGCRRTVNECNRAIFDNNPFGIMVNPRHALRALVQTK
jgi:hypothetical protein